MGTTLRGNPDGGPSRLGASLLVFGSLLSLVSAQNLRAETAECNVLTSMPARIYSQGVYCLMSDQVYNTGSGYAITINTNNVTIDFNGFRLGGLGAGPSTTATGVYALDRKNITIKNANIRGYYRGVFLHGGEGHVIEDSSFDRNILMAIYIMNSTDVIIRRNRIVNQLNENGYTYGILATGARTLVEDNYVAAVRGAWGNIYGILTGASGATIRNNTVIDVLADASNTEIATSDRAIATIGESNIVENNQIANPSGTGEFGVIALSGADTAYCTRNEVLNFADANYRCTDGPDNHFPDAPAPLNVETSGALDDAYAPPGQ